MEIMISEAWYRKGFVKIKKGDRCDDTITQEDEYEVLCLKEGRKKHEVWAVETVESWDCLDDSQCHVVCDVAVRACKIRQRTFGNSSDVRSGELDGPDCSTDPLKLRTLGVGAVERSKSMS
jgi:hypothetical protein